MFIYVKYEDGVKEAISMNRILNFDIKNINFEKKYTVQWDDDNLYNGIIGKIQGKPVCGASKEEVEGKAKGKRVEFLPLTLCDTATEFETDSEIERSHRLEGNANLKERIEEKILRIKRNQSKNEETNKMSAKNREPKKDKKGSAYNSQKNEKKGTQKTDKKKNPVLTKKLVTNNKEDIIKKKTPLCAKTEVKERQNNNGLNDLKRTAPSIGENSESIDCLIQKQEKFNGSDKDKKTIAQLLKENKHLRSQSIKLKGLIKDKEIMINELITLNMDLQKQVISEYTEISKINKEIQTKVLNNFDELLHVVSEYFKKNSTIPQEQIGLPPIGYENKTRNEVHLGFDVYVPKSSYDSVLVISKSIPQFIKNLAVAVFGIKILKESTVTGTVSNRKKKSKNEDPRPPLDPTKLKAIRATVKHYLKTQYDLDEISIDFELQHLGSHIAHKICELNRNPKSTGLRIQARSLCTTVITNKNNESNEKENKEKNNDKGDEEENDDKESNETTHDTQNDDEKEDQEENDEEESNDTTHETENDDEKGNEEENDETESNDTTHETENDDEKGDEEENDEKEGNDTTHDTDESNDII